MKKGFTLIELLIVTVIIATLMGVVFRLAGMGGSASARNRTITRMQKLENCLSGYFSAFGSYPPVALYNSRNVYVEANEFGIQGTRTVSNLKWENVEAVCLSQPLAAEFPYSRKWEDYFRAKSKIDNASYDCLSSVNSGRFGNELNSSTEWSKIQLFKFGVMAYLLPRYQFMLEGKDILYDSKQWAAANRLSSMYSFKDGTTNYSSWDEIQRGMGYGDSGSSSWSDSKRGEFLNQPSQAVCARWMQNLEGIVAGGMEFYGINTADGAYGERRGLAMYRPGVEPDNAGSKTNGGGQDYVLNGMTVLDGWDRDFYYYSPPPFQRYTLWSGGPDKRTFPPWIDISSLGSTSDRNLAGKWIADDIVHLAN